MLYMHEESTHNHIFLSTCSKLAFKQYQSRERQKNDQDDQIPARDTEQKEHRPSVICISCTIPI